MLSIIFGLSYPLFMKIVVDNRETKLIHLLNNHIDNKNEIIIKTLELGDIIICDDDGKELLL